MSSIPRKIFGSGKKQKTLADVGVSNIADEKIRKRIDEYKELDICIKACTVLPETEVGTVKLKSGQPKLRKGKEIEILRPVSPEKKVEQIIENLQKVNGKLQEISIPWGRSADQRWYSEAMMGWSKLFTEILSWATGTARQLKRIALESEDPLRSQNELVSKLHTAILLVFVKYAQIMYGISWSRDDVANSWALTIYQPPMPTSGRIGFDDLQRRHEPEEMREQ